MTVDAEVVHDARDGDGSRSLLVPIVCDGGGYALEFGVHRLCGHVVLASVVDEPVCCSAP